MATSNTDTGDTIISTAVETTTTTTTTTAATAAAAEPAVTEPAPGTPLAMAPREALITTAVNFLQNSKVRHTTLLQKQQFLRSKGLTEPEIQLACERAGVFSLDPNAPTVINMGISSQLAHSQLAVQSASASLSAPPQATTVGRIKELLHSMALLGGVAYAIYMFWKKFVESFLFGRKKKKKPLDECLADIDRKVDARLDDVNRELTHIKDTLTQQQRDQQQQFAREFNNFRSDLDAIKGLLLNRKQFALPLNAGPPLIPPWQLSASSPPPHRHHHLHSQSDNDNEKGDDAGSGSGSSETEVVTKNSDSSLEIM